MSILLWIAVWVLGGAVLGFLLVPAVAFLGGKSLALTAFSRVLFTIQQLATGGTAVNQRGDGNGYEQRIVEDRETDEGETVPHMFTRHGEWEPIEDGEAYRLGKERFWLTFDKDEAFLAPVRAEEDRGDDLGVVADGGMAYTDSRGGYLEWTPFTGSEDGIICRVSAVVDKLHGRGGTEGSKTAKDVALAKYGGDDSMSNKMIIIGGLTFLVVGSLMGFVMFSGVL
jgi:hypothetical protein